MICVESGFEIQIGGAAGLHVRQSELLAKVATEDEAMQTIVAVLQLYWEQGFYLERMYNWAPRVGLDSIRAQVVDDADSRAALVERFVRSQRFAQVDPWAERARGVEAAEFAPLMTPRLMAAE